jgi:hypothetical protein
MSPTQKRSQREINHCLLANEPPRDNGFCLPKLFAQRFDIAQHFIGVGHDNSPDKQLSRLEINPLKRLISKRP